MAEGIAPLDPDRWFESLLDTELDPVSRESFDPSTLPVQMILDCLGGPQRNYSAIHVTGTNGKGSVVAMTTAILDAAGCSTGSFTSPDLGSVRERIKVYLQEVKKDELELELSTVATLVDQFSLPRPSKFEALVATALSVFSNNGVEVAVVEVGMGGELDATNVLDARVVVCTNIGSDHMAQLGGSREGIAKAKSGIVHNGSKVILGDVDEAFFDFFAKRTDEKVIRLGSEIIIESDLLAVGGRQISFRTARSEFKEIFVPLSGSFQGKNVALATAAAEEYLERGVPSDLLQSVLLDLKIPGRMEIVGHSPLCVLDVAHNYEAAGELGKSLRDSFGYETGWVVLYAATHKRDPKRFLEALGPSSIDRLISVDLGLKIQVDPYDVASAASSLGILSSVAGDPGSALIAARERLIEGQIVLGTGSHYLVGGIRRLLLGFD